MWELVVAADDRTGALEVAGEIAARIGRPVPMVPFRSAFAHEPAQGGWSLRERGGAGGDGPALVVDLGSRHLDVGEARARAVAVEAIRSRRRAHKLDSALRGHWADEVAARLAVAPGDAAVVAALPAAGRLVRGGVVLQRDADGTLRPIADAMADDARGGPAGSRPGQLLAAAGAPGGIAVVDVEDSRQLDAVAADLARRADVLLVGTAAAVAAWAAPGRNPSRPALPPAGRILVVCGSAHPTARSQLDAVDDPRVTVLTPPDPPSTPIDDVAAEVVAAQLAVATAEAVAALRPDVVVVLGGDTAAAVLRDAPMHVRPPLQPGAPVSRRADGTGPWFVTRSGSFGDEDALAALLDAVFAGSEGCPPTRPT